MACSRSSPLYSSGAPHSVVCRNLIIDSVKTITHTIQLNFGLSCCLFHFSLHEWKYILYAKFNVWMKLWPDVVVEQHRWHHQVCWTFASIYIPTVVTGGYEPQFESPFWSALWRCQACIMRSRLHELIKSFLQTVKVLRDSDRFHSSLEKGKKFPANCIGDCRLRIRCVTTTCHHTLLLYSSRIPYSNNLPMNGHYNYSIWPHFL